MRPAQAAGDARVLFSCGVPMSGVSLRIIDPDTRAQREDGTVGEVWLSSPCVTAGYFNKPDLSAQVFQVFTALQARPQLFWACMLSLFSRCQAPSR